VNVAALVARASQVAPDKPAVAVGKIVTLTYGQLADRIARIGGAFARDRELRPGQRIAIVMANSAEYLEILFGIWWAGLVAVPINSKLHPREVSHILQNSGARVCVVSPDWAESILPTAIGRPQSLVASHSVEYERLLAAEPIPPIDRAPTDTAWLFYTSGTTGQPKGVMITHRNLAAMTLNYFADVDSIDAGDCIVHAAPMSHGSGLYSLPHVAKCALNVIPDSGGFDPKEIAALVGWHPGVTMFAAPTMVRRLLDWPGLGSTDTSHLKTIVYGGGPMFVTDLEDAINRLGQKFVQIYGQGESPMTITCLSRAHHADTSDPRYRARLGSVGRPFTGVEVKVTTEDDHDLPPGSLGEVLVRGDTVMKGYWRNPEATAQALTGGWLHTGDLGMLDDEGFLTLMSRSKDLVVSGGANIYPREVEEVLLSHDAVVEAAVVGRQHPEWGEEVVAFVVLKPGCHVEEKALDALCLDNLARFKRPRQYRFIGSLPKNNYGKVLKTELRRWLTEEEDAWST